MPCVIVSQCFELCRIVIVIIIIYYSEGNKYNNNNDQGTSEWHPALLSIFPMQLCRCPQSVVQRNVCAEVILARAKLTKQTSLWVQSHLTLTRVRCSG